MKVEIVCFGAMREYLPPSTAGNRAAIDIREAGTVGDLVDTLGAPRRLVFSVLVDGEQAELSSQLREGSEVTLMPPFAGGSR